MPQVFHLGGGSSNFGLDSHLHRVQLGNGSERVVVQMNANGQIEFSNPSLQSIAPECIVKKPVTSKQMTIVTTGNLTKA